jgi:hypothetical protein
MRLAGVLLALMTASPAGADSSAGEPGAVILARGERVIFVEKRADEWLLFARRDAKTPPVELDKLGPGERVELGQLSATLGVFLGHPELLEVVLHRIAEEAQHASASDKHYVLRLRPAGDELACRFDGTHGASSEYHSSHTGAVVRKVADAPLRFDIVYGSTSSSRRRNGGQSSSSSRTVRYTLPANGACEAKQ